MTLFEISEGSERLLSFTSKSRRGLGSLFHVTISDVFFSSRPMLMFKTSVKKAASCNLKAFNGHLKWFWWRQENEALIWGGKIYPCHSPVAASCSIVSPMADFKSIKSTLDEWNLPAHTLIHRRISYRVIPLHSNGVAVCSNPPAFNTFSLWYGVRCIFRVKPQPTECKQALG